MKNIRKIRADYEDSYQREEQKKAYWSDGAYVEFMEDNDTGYKNKGAIRKVVDNLGMGNEPYYIIVDDSGTSHNIPESKILGEG